MCKLDEGWRKNSEIMVKISVNSVTQLAGCAERTTRPMPKIDAGQTKHS